MSVTSSSHGCHVTFTSQCPDLQWTCDQHDAVWVLCPVGRCAWTSRGTGPHIKPTTRGKSEQCLGRREERGPSDCESTLHHWVKDGTINEGDYMHTYVCTTCGHRLHCPSDGGVCASPSLGIIGYTTLQNAIRKMPSI